MNTISRNITYQHHISSSVVTVSRGSFQLLLSSLLISKLSVPDTSGSQKSLLVLRALLGGAASYCRFICLSRLKVALASALLATTPVFAIVLGLIFLHRPVLRSDILSIFFCCSGATLITYDSITGQSEGRVSATPIIAGIGSAALTASSYVVVRVMGTKVHFILNVFVTSIANILLPIATVGIRKQRAPLVLHFFREEIKRIDDWWIYCRLGLVGVLGFGGASCLNHALQSMAPSRAATIRTMDIPLNTIAAFVILAELPSSSYQVFGGVLVALGAYTSAMNKTI
ncbi:unnamed protein product [Agarophyton chilense]